MIGLSHWTLAGIEGGAGSFILGASRSDDAGGGSVIDFKKRPCWACGVVIVRL